MKKKNARPEPDGQVISIQIGDEPQKVIKICSDLPKNVKVALVECLKNYAHLFARSVADMTGISPDIACHRLFVHPNAKWIAQRRRYQSEEKAKAAAKVVEDLIQPDFVKEVKFCYPTRCWLRRPTENGGCA